MPYEGHQDECFSVQEQRFCYSDYAVSAGFHTSASHGGPIRAGLPVRIAYSGGTILRLEIPRDQVVSPAEAAATLKTGEENWQKRSENDPLDRRMMTAFLFTAACWTLWWNLQWKIAMRFWVRPPNRPWVQTLFRVFFMVSFLSAMVQFFLQLHKHPVGRQEVGSTVEIAGAMCAVVALMSAAVVGMAHYRDRKAKAA